MCRLTNAIWDFFIDFRSLFNKFRTNSLIYVSVLLSFTMISCSSPQSEFVLLSGEKKSLEDYRGQWVLVNFWAEWCRPCLEEIPELNKLHQNRAALNATLLAFSYDKVSNESLEKIQAQWQIEYPMVLTDPSPMVPFERPSKLPAMLLISPEGEVHGPLFGKQSEQTVSDAIEVLLNKVR